MGDTARNRRNFGCFGFWRHKSRKKTQSASATCTVESDLVVDMDGDLCSGALDTFASCQMEKKSEYRTRMVMRPYFGRFAGQWLTFDLRRSESMVSIKVKVEGSDRPITTLYQRSSSRVVDCTSSVRDRCLLFAHDVPKSSSAKPKEPEEFELLRREPLSLSFLCERTILLHLGDLPVSQLPPKYSSVFSASGSQELKVRVWPKQVSSGVTMLLKPRISVRELQWMLCKRLSTISPSSISLYVPDSLECLPVNASIECGLSQVECVVQPSTSPLQCLPVTVSVIGNGVQEVPINPTMTLFEFEEAVRKQFSLKQDSFLYMPQVYKNRKSSQWGLKMTALIDETTVSLIDPINRNFPVVDGIPSLQIRKKYEQLPVYQTSIYDLHFLKSSPVIVFEVAGPTIPVAFKTMQAPSSSAIDASPHNSVFALVLVKPHAISVSCHWTVATLLKYIESISGFPCEHIRIGSVVLEPTSFVASHLMRCWFLKTKSGKIALPNSRDIPFVTPL